MTVNALDAYGQTSLLYRLGANNDFPSALATRSVSNGSLSTVASAKDGISRTFAQDIVRRLGQSATDTAATEVAGAERTDKDNALAALEQSLERAVDFVRSQFGDQAATAVVGLVYKNIGEGEVGEESLGNGLLQGLSFIDRQLGYAAGDKYIAFLNQDLNDAVNTYFDNGLNEQFLVADAATSQQVATVSSLATSLGAEQGQEAAQSILDILQQGLEGSERDLAKALEEARARLAELGVSTEAALAGQQALPGYGNTPADQSQTGVALDITV